MSEEDNNGGGASTNEAVLWDRKINGGFPDVEWLKGAVRDVIESRRQVEEEEYVEYEDDEDDDEEEYDEGDDVMLSI